MRIKYISKECIDNKIWKSNNSNFRKKRGHVLNIICHEIEDMIK